MTENEIGIPSPPTRITNLVAILYFLWDPCISFPFHSSIKQVNIFFILIALFDFHCWQVNVILTCCATNDGIVLLTTVSEEGGTNGKGNDSRSKANGLRTGIRSNVGAPKRQRPRCVGVSELPSGPYLFCSYLGGVFVCFAYLVVLLFWKMKRE